VAGAFDATKKIRDEYTKHVTATFHLLGDDNATAAKNTEAVMRIENSLSQATIMTVAEFAASAPNIEWTSYVSAAKLASSDPISV
jgi:putative endopeptidase